MKKEKNNKKQLVFNFIKKNPQGTKAQCTKETKLSPITVSKYWNEYYNNIEENKKNNTIIEKTKKYIEKKDSNEENLINKEIVIKQENLIDKKNVILENINNKLNEIVEILKNIDEKIKEKENNKEKNIDSFSLLKNTKEGIKNKKDNMLEVFSNSSEEIEEEVLSDLLSINEVEHIQKKQEENFEQAQYINKKIEDISLYENIKVKTLAEIKDKNNVNNYSKLEKPTRYIKEDSNTNLNEKVEQNESILDLKVLNSFLEEDQEELEESLDSNFVKKENKLSNFLVEEDFSKEKFEKEKNNENEYLLQQNNKLKTLPKTSLVSLKENINETNEEVITNNNYINNFEEDSYKKNNISDYNDILNEDIEIEKKEETNSYDLIDFMKKKEDEEDDILEDEQEDNKLDTNKKSFFSKLFSKK